MPQSAEDRPLYHTSCPRLMFIVGGYEIAYDSDTRRFLARVHGEPGQELAPWQLVEDGEIATDLVRGVRITRPLQLGEHV